MAGGLDLFSIASMLQSVSLVGLLGLAGRLYFLWRKQNVSDFDAARAGYGDIVTLLRQEVAQLAADHRKCHQDLSGLRTMFSSLQFQVVAIATRYAIPLDDMTPEIRALFERASKALDAGAE